MFNIMKINFAHLIRWISYKNITTLFFLITEWHFVGIEMVKVYFFPFMLE